MDEIRVAEQIWQENEAYIRKFCTYKLSSHPDLVDDCLQDIFLALLNFLHDEKEITYPKAWLTKVASNKINDIYKAENKKTQTEVPFEEEYVKANEDFDYSGTEGITEKEIEKHLQEILGTLSDKEKALIEDFCINKLSGKEIAEKMGISENNFRQQIFRVKRKVKKSIREVLK